MDDYEKLKFASLFHDIGKFYQRADNNFNPSFASKYKNLDAYDYGEHGAHSKWSADFVSNFFDESVENLVLYHHNPTKSKSINYDLAKIIQISDHHSSKERIKSNNTQNVKTTPLISIFSRISLDDNNHEDFFIPPVKLSFDKDLYPKSNEEIKDWNMVKLYKRLWNEFKDEFKLIPNQNFENYLAILKKYTATIPSAAYNSLSDISLYDHSKTTVAIANCRYLFSKQESLSQRNDQKVYRIINGDISGIQNFIYRVNSPEDAQNGMSKRLRGRSLYLSLLSEAIADKLILDLNLDSSNILFCGGGRFIIIAPNTNKTLDVIETIGNQINSYFIKKFNSELYLSLVSLEANGLDLENFDRILSDVKNLIDDDKKHKFIGQLDDVFLIEEDEIDYDICHVCGNKTHNENKICSECNSHEELGKNVANSQYLVKYVSNDEIPSSDFYVDVLNIGFKFFKSKEDVINLVNKNLNVEFIIYKLNDTEFLDFTSDILNNHVSFDFKALANSIPNVNGQPLYFNHLAQISKGSNKLGVLKMDVDNLGRIFTQGFKKILKDEDEISISRISSLSFYLDLFFSGYINKIAGNFKVFPENYGHDELFRKEKLEFDIDKDIIIKTVYKPNTELSDEFNDIGTSTIHINYSGGDDLLVIGPYDDIIKFAGDFREQFKKWTTFNDSINISGGVFNVSPKFPIGKAALMADDELEKSKDCGKDKITIFNEVFNWDSHDKIGGFNDLLNFGEYLESLCPNTLSKGFIYSLLKIWKKSGVDDLSIFNEKSWNDKNNDKLSTKRFVPLFAYKLRLINDSDVKNYLEKNGIKFMPWIKLPVTWVSLRLR